VIQSRTRDYARWRENLLNFAELLEDLENEADKRALELLTAAKQSRKSTSKGAKK
jgi:hypothetical protein